MIEYTFADIIMDPEDPRLEGAIGKECWLSDYPKGVLDYARNNLKEFRLKSIDKEDNFPFVDNNHEDNWALIIIKKEEPKPTCVPFKNIREFLLSYSCYERLLKEDNCFLSNRGIWLMDCENGDYFLVTEIWGDGVVLGSNQTTTHWDDLLEEFIFLDGSPCGKEVKDE